MIRIIKFSLLGTVICLAGLGALVAQPPGGQDKGKQPPGKIKTTRPEPKADPVVDAWVKTLTDKMTDRHDTVRNSSRAALVAIGRPALPALAKLAESQDSAVATAAKSVMGKIGAGSKGFNRPAPFGLGGFQRFDPRKGNWGGQFGKSTRPGFPGESGFSPKGFAPGKGPMGPRTGKEKVGPQPELKKSPGEPPARSPNDTKGDGKNRGKGDGKGKGFSSVGFGGFPYERFGKELNLSDKQNEQIKAAVEENKKKAGEYLDKLRKDNQRPDFSKIPEAMRPLQEEMKKKIDSILNAEQKKKLEELKKSGPGTRQPGNRPDSGPGRRGGSPEGRPPE
ncbi:MAG: hypothetical protein EXR99_02475 [Gemmataceae bacterium]|nr:hypothetical protein [Gemmataceae bacterium]